MTEPTRVHVPLRDRAYDILIGEDLLEGAGERLTAMFPGRRFGIVTDSEVAVAQLPRLTLAQRHGTESEVSAAVMFLLSDAASYITGHELLVAGGSDLVNGLLEIPAHDRMPPFSGFHRSMPPDALATVDAEPPDARSGG